MRHHKMAVCLVLAGAVIAAGLVWTYSPRGRPRLNVLLITLDTTRADHLGCYGAAVAKTATLDALAERGVLFERAYAPVPLTLPSHAAMFTGLLPPEHGVRLNGAYRLDESIPTLAEQLSKAGYRTGGFIGAFVLDRQFGLNRGFDVYNDDLHGDRERTNGIAPAPGSHAPADDGHDHKERPGAEVVDAALAWLNDEPDEPFFCWVHVFDPHLPYLPHAELFGSQFEDRPYDAELAYVDVQVQRLVDFLKETNAGEQTLVIIAGDHGESLGEHGEQTHGYTLYNATLHVPLIFSCPSLWKNKVRVSEPVSLVDLTPTVLELLDLPSSSAHSGRSLAAAAAGRPFPSLPCYAETLQPEYEAHWSPQFGLITERWKYIRSPRRELYDLQDDPRELTNLAEHHPEKVEAFEAQLADWESSMTPRDAPLAPLTPDAQRTLASLGYASGNDGAMDAAQTGVDAGENGPADIKDRIAYYNQYIAAVRLLHQGELEEAASELQAVVAAVPDYFKAQYNLGVCLMRLKRYAEAAETFERAIEIDANPTALVSLAKAKLSQNRPAEALAPLKQAQQLQPQSEEIRFLLQDARQGADER
ncbi:MAG: sulfatase-like hydrolase/transferase [Planctomycetaceae bacterium]